MIEASVSFFPVQCGACHDVSQLETESARHEHPTPFFVHEGPRWTCLDPTAREPRDTQVLVGRRDASGALEMTCGGHSHAAEQEAPQVKERQEVISKMCNVCAVSQDQAFRDNGNVFVWITQKRSSARWGWSEDSFVCGRFMTEAMFVISSVV